MFHEFPKAIYLTPGQPIIVESAEHEARLMARSVAEVSDDAVPHTDIAEAPDDAVPDTDIAETPRRRGRPPKRSPE